MKLDRKRVLILGATSAVAQEFARRMAERQSRVVLVARHAGRLDAVASDLRARGSAAVVPLLCNLSCIEGHDTMLDQAWESFGGIDLALIAYGTYAERGEAEETPVLRDLLETDFVSAAHLAVRISARFAHSNSGHLAVITSVAGDRGRKRNYIYAAAKGGLSVLLQGLDHKLAGSSVRISDIKLGMTDTPMTAQMPDSPLKVSPAKAVAAMLAGLERQRAVIYAPAFWRWIMLAVKLLPRRVIQRLDL